MNSFERLEIQVERVLHYPDCLPPDTTLPQRDDRRFAHVAAWEYGEGTAPALYKESLAFEFVQPTTRSYQYSAIQVIKSTLKIRRQQGPDERGRFVTHETRDVSSGMSFLEMLDSVNQGLIAKGKEPVAFEQDCREGICGSCSLVINGIPHGLDRGIATSRNASASVSSPF